MSNSSVLSHHVFFDPHHSLVVQAAQASDLFWYIKKLILREAKQAARVHTVVGSQDLNWYLAGSNAHYIILFFFTKFFL